MQPRKVRLWSQADLNEILTPPLAGEVPREGESRSSRRLTPLGCGGDGAGAETRSVESGLERMCRVAATRLARDRDSAFLCIFHVSLNNQNCLTLSSVSVTLPCSCY